MRIRKSKRLSIRCFSPDEIKRAGWGKSSLGWMIEGWERLQRVVGWTGRAIRGRGRGRKIWAGVWTASTGRVTLEGGTDAGGVDGVAD